MFGFSFREKVEKVIASEFGYQVPHMMRPIFNMMVSDLRAKNSNEFDVAVLYMSASMYGLSVNPESRDFVKKHLQNMQRISSRVSFPLSQIDVMIKDLQSKFLLIDNAKRYQNFEDWYVDYKEGFYEVKPALRPEREGDSSIIDFLDNSPLERAFSDGIEPRNLGRRNGEKFDLDKLLQSS